MPSRPRDPLNSRLFGRRAFLRGALAATLVGPSLTGCATPARPEVAGRDPFSLGVTSGEPAPDGFVLWTRLAPVPLWSDPAAPGGLVGGDVTLTYEIAADPGMRTIVQSGPAVAEAAYAYSVHLEVTGLAAARPYWYRFTHGDAQSRIGRAWTGPEPRTPLRRLRFAFVSCANYEHGFFSAYRHLADEQPDLVLFLGDYIYEYPNAKNAVRAPTGGWVRTLDDYRQRYALHKSDPDLQAMHAACPWLVTWDDHEVQNDYAGLSEGQSGTPVADFAALRAAAYQAYYEHMPLRASVLTRALAGLGTGAEMRIYSTVRFGTLASFHLLDDRQYRDPQACTRDGTHGSSTVDPATCSDWNDPRRTLLGAAQERWLDDAFAQGSKGWNVLGLQTLFGARDFRSGPGQTFWNDGWDGYPAARARMIASMRKHSLANPVLFGGDVHQNWVGHVKADYADPRSPSIGVEFCGTSITSQSHDRGRIKDILARNPHFVFADAERHGYGVVEFTPKQLTTSLRVVSDVTRRDSTIETLARFSVEAGRSAIVAG